MPLKDHTSYQEKFNDLSQDISSLFKSFQSLSEIYSQSFSDISKKVNDLPEKFRDEVFKAAAMLDGCKYTVEREQEKISNKLYQQGIVLLVGSSESLLRDAFRNLIRNNLDKISIKDKHAFTFTEIQKAGKEGFPDLVLEKLENISEPAEKLNFQNIEQTKGLFKGYLEITFSSDLPFLNLHKYWQIRHIIVHKRGVVDQKFLNNLAAAKIDVKIYKEGENINISRENYDECLNDLMMLFQDLDKQVSEKNLQVS